MARAVGKKTITFEEGPCSVRSSRRTCKVAARDVLRGAVITVCGTGIDRGETK